MTTAKYSISKLPGESNLWSVARHEHEGWTQPPSWLSLEPVESRRYFDLGHATTLSGAVAIAEEHAQRKLTWNWADSFQRGEGQ